MSLLGPQPAQPSPPYPQAPVVEKTNAILCLVLNVFLPGSGTVVGGILGNMKLIGRGFAQLLLWIVIVGWVWSIVTGLQMIQNAAWAERQPRATA